MPLPTHLRKGCRALLRLLALLVVTLLVLAATAVFWVERQISGLESAVWDRAALHELEPREEFLEIIATARLLPDSLEVRASGLRGDLAHHRGDDDDAAEHYKMTKEWLFGSGRGAMMSFVKSIPALFTGGTDFARGFQEYKSKATAVPPVDEAALGLAAPVIARSEEDWRAFQAVPALEDAEAEMTRGALNNADDHPADTLFAVELCSRHQALIDALCRLQHPPIPPDPDDVPDLRSLSGFIQLLTLDALHQAAADDKAAARASLDAVYNLLGTMEQQPRLQLMSFTTQLRSELADLLESEHGARLRPFFSEQHRLPEKIWESICAGEYQAMKRLLARTLAGGDPDVRRLHALVLSKNAAFWGKARREGMPIILPNTSDAEAVWFYRNRRFFQRADTASHAEGLQAAAENEDFMAELTHRISTVSMGGIEQDIAALRAREAALASKSAP